MKIHIIIVSRLSFNNQPTTQRSNLPFFIKQRYLIARQHLKRNLMNSTCCCDNHRNPFTNDTSRMETRKEGKPCAITKQFVWITKIVSHFKNRKTFSSFHLGFGEGRKGFGLQRKLSWKLFNMLRKHRSDKKFHLRILIFKCERSFDYSNRNY